MKHDIYKVGEDLSEWEVDILLGAIKARALVPVDEPLYRYVVKDWTGTNNMESRLVRVNGAYNE